MFSRSSTRQTLLLLLTAALLLTSCNVGATPAPTQDINALSTALVGTTVAQLSVQFTQTALAAPTNTVAPTDTPATPPTFALPTQSNPGTAATGNPAALPTLSFVNTPAPGITQIVSLPTSAAPATASLGDACNNNVFIQDTTIPDGTVMKPGEDFYKIWRVQNTGNCTWDEGYTLVLVTGDNLDGPTYKIQDKVDFVSPGETADLGIKMTAHLKEGTYSGCWKMKSDTGFFFGTFLCVTIKVVK